MEDNVNVSGEIFSAKDNNPDVGKLKDFGWLSKSFEREKLISDNYYKSIRSRIHKGFKEEVINFNHNTLLLYDFLRKYSICNIPVS